MNNMPGVRRPAFRLVGSLLILGLAGVVVLAQEHVDEQQPIPFSMRRFSAQLGKLADNADCLTPAQIQEALKTQPHRHLDLAARTERSLSGSDLYAACRDSVVVVGKLYKCPKCHRWHPSVASGFVIGADGLVVTNYHVLDTGDVETKAVGVSTRAGQVVGVREVVAVSQASDLAVIRVDASGLSALPVSAGAAVGAHVYCLSHPVNHLYTLTEGIVSGYVQLGQRREMTITADFAKGSSGGPILDESGAVVGVVRATQPVYYEQKDGQDTKLQMVWKYCIPSAALRELVK